MKTSPRAPRGPSATPRPPAPAGAGASPTPPHSYTFPTTFRDVGAPSMPAAASEQEAGPPLGSRGIRSFHLGERRAAAGGGGGGACAAGAPAYERRIARDIFSSLLLTLNSSPGRENREEQAGGDVRTV